MMKKSEKFGRFIINLGAVNKKGYRSVLDNDLVALGPVIPAEIEPYITYIADGIVIPAEEYKQLLDTQIQKGYVCITEEEYNHLKSILTLMSKDQKILLDTINRYKENTAKLEEELEALKEELKEYKKADPIKFNENSVLYIGSKVSILKFPEDVPEAIKSALYNMGELSEENLIKGVVCNIRCKLDNTSYLTRRYEDETYDVKFNDCIVLEGLTRDCLINLDL